ncbi:MAG: nucleoside-diphosphate kinase [Elusimicrobia bacterium]|nr:nucleoside-diphosphate kinase [Elusimicrobiota bacterium]
MEQTLVLIKPDGFKRGLTGLVIDRLDNAGLELVAARMVRVTDALAREHYRDLQDKPFFPNLIRYIRGEFHALAQSQVLALVLQGENAIVRVRQIAGATNPEQADPHSIRGSFGRVTTQGQFENVLHASGNAADAEREVKLWFKPEEVLTPIFPTAAAANGKAPLPAKVWA